MSGRALALLPLSWATFLLLALDSSTCTGLREGCELQSDVESRNASAVDLIDSAPGHAVGHAGSPRNLTHPPVQQGRAQPLPPSTLLLQEEDLPAPQEVNVFTEIRGQEDWPQKSIADLSTEPDSTNEASTVNRVNGVRGVKGTGSSPSSRAARKRRKPVPLFGSNGIRNAKGGQVMRNPINVYIVWLGYFTSSQKALVRTFIRSLNPSQDPAVTLDYWWAINSRYYGGRLVKGKPTGGTVSTAVTLRGEVAASAASLALQNNVLRDVAGVVRRFLGPHKWKPDPDGIYVVLSDKSITQVGSPSPGGASATSCKRHCGWHYHFGFGGVRLKYLWVGIPGCTICGAKDFFTNGGGYFAPSLDDGIHQALSILGHEISEVVTDPYISSWYDRSKQENADKCAYDFGALKVVRRSDGTPGIWNLAGLGGSKFLIQSNWHPVHGKCMLHN